MGDKYSEKKIMAWRFGRTFLSVFLILFGTGLSEVDDVGMAKALAVSALSGATVMLGKGIRTYFKHKNIDLYQSIVKKLPI